MHTPSPGGAMQGGRSLRVQLAVTNFILLTAILGLLMVGVAMGVKKAILENAEANMAGGVTALRNFLDASDKDLQVRMRAMMGSLMYHLDGELRLQPRDDTTQLILDGTLLNNNHDLVDDISRTVHDSVTTVFARQGQDFVRIASSVKSSDGQRAVGTLLDRNSPAYAAVQAGKEYQGVVALFGKKYMTYYRPLKNAQNEVVGLAFVGQSLASFQDELKQAIRQLKVGDTGYYFVLQGSGEGAGDFVVHPVQANEGKSIMGFQTADGRYFGREMVSQKSGVMYYEWMNPGENSTRRKIAVFDYYAPWDWLIAASTYEDELTSQATKMVLVFSIMGVVAVLALAGIWMYLIGRLIIRPLQDVTEVAQAVAQGDLTVRATVTRRDEIGHLLETINQTAQSLSEVVSTVRSRAESVAMASTEIAHGNQDLSNRTESQASALQETAAAMEELGSTVAHNAENAKTADQLAQEASRVVTEGGEAVREAVHTMQGIDASSKKIADIIGVIDGIAFQTNILALNAAVEAARAGEHGRGFAVVAAEVRSLAQRSAAAAKEIKQLINDSVAEIGQGNVRAARAGETMEQAITEIRKVSSLISNISLASVEQSNGVSQAAEAVTNMEQATQQNAAMVEQVAASAQTLRQQSDELVQAVSIFRLAGRGNAASYSAPAATTAASSAAPAPGHKPAAQTSGSHRAPAPAPKPASAAASTAAAAPARLGGGTPPAHHPTPAAHPPAAPAAAAKAAASKAATPAPAPKPAAAAGSEDDWESF